MKVLVVGSGGREHAIAWKISQSPLLTKLYCLPGNPGTAGFAENVDLPVSNLGAIAIWAVEHQIDLTVVGPEAPLAGGIVDIFTEHGLRIFGPTKAAAQLEASKSFAKEVMLKAGVPTATAKIFEDFAEAKQYVLECGAPIVIKADGLAAGKGVTVAQTVDQAIAALEECLQGQRFGSSGAKVVVEQFIRGREASVMGIVDGATVIPLVVSQDYKRLRDQDLGPNTGGMGAISPTPVLPDAKVEHYVGEVFVPVLQELFSRGIKYVGFLYAGLIIDESGHASVLEFNCRLGDPETQVLLPRMRSDLLLALDAAVDGRLSSVELEWTKQAAVCIVAASGGYPEQVDDGKEITGLSGTDENGMVYHAGTKFAEGDSTKIVSKGGRVLTVSALAPTVEEARRKAYLKLKGISFDGMQYRSDIGLHTDERQARVNEE